MAAASSARSRVLGVVALAALSGGCTGSIRGGAATGGGGGTGGAPPSAGVAGGAAPAGAAGASGVAGTGGGGAAGATMAAGDLPLPRLSRDEYIQTVRDLVKQVMPAVADQVLAGPMNLTGDLPTDALVTIPSEKHG